MFDDVYKTDISFGVSATGDVDRISGVNNLKEWIFRTIVTTVGSLAHRPNHGGNAKKYQNDLATLERKRKFASEIIEQLEKDDRIEKVLGVGFSPDPANTFMTIVRVRVEAVGVGEQTFSYTVGDLP